MANKNTFNIGDEVTAFLKHSSTKRIKIRGKIKKIEKYWGLDTYTITEGVAEDFPTRIILKK